MKQGFDNRKGKVYVDEDEIKKLLKSFKKIKKYKKSSIHEIKKIGGEKDIIQELMDEYYKNPIDL